MSIDLSANLRKTLEKALEGAEKAQKEGDGEKAAGGFEIASRLLLKYAEYAPSRALEKIRKKRALSLREKAKRLRCGEALDRGSRAEPSGEKDAVEKDLSWSISPMIHTSGITWGQIGGLEETKNEIKYTLGIILATPPSKVRLQNWRNILFFGPPGTGKTLLAAATSNTLRSEDNSKAVFFNVKVSSVLSKYFGESSKIISELYGTARDASPSVIFLDEFESLCATRDQGDTGAERRILSTILAELDGLAEKGKSGLYVITIAATNRPWDLDPAVLSRFEKKILIPLPDEKSRERILQIHLHERGFNVDAPLKELVAMTQGFSGREIEQFCKEVTNRMVFEMNSELPSLVDQGLETLRSYRIKIRTLMPEDFTRARAMITPQTSKEENRRYLTWKESLSV